MNDTWIIRYRLSLRFASFFNTVHRYDIVHEAWIYYLDKTGDDLFEIDLKDQSSFLYTVVKKAFYRWWYHERKDQSKYRYESVDILRSTAHDPQEILVASDLYNQFYRKLELMTEPSDKRHYRTINDRQLPLKIFKLKSEGYRGGEIATQLQVSKQLINFYINKIEQMLWINPFAGSKLQVTKTLTESQWEKRSDKLKFEMEHSNEYYTLYRHIEENTGLLVRLPKTDHYIPSK